MVRLTCKLGKYAQLVLLIYLLRVCYLIVVGAGVAINSGTFAKARRAGYPMHGHVGVLFGHLSWVLAVELRMGRPATKWSFIRSIQGIGSWCEEG